MFFGHFRAVAERAFRLFQGKIRVVFAVDEFGEFIGKHFFRAVHAFVFVSAKFRDFVKVDFGEEFQTFSTSASSILRQYWKNS